MKAIDVTTLEGVEFTGGISYRPVNKNDGMGFSVCKTVIPKGGPHLWHYKNHKEMCYCIEGHAMVENLENGEVHQLTPDVCYIVDNHERHAFTAFEDTVLISVFNPPLTGTETHNEDGVYE